jgi:hypothetical protein
MSHENESKDTTPIELLREQYRADYTRIQRIVSLDLKTENQLRRYKTNCN